MPLIACSECAAMVSTAATACPGCGAPPKIIQQSAAKKPLGLGSKLFLGLLGAGVLGAAIQAGVAPEEGPQKSPEEVASDARNRAGYSAVTALKPSLREPDSMQFDSIAVDEKAEVVCLVYRGRNAFGGVSRERVLYLAGVPSQSRALWNKRCRGGSLYDLTLSPGWSTDPLAAGPCWRQAIPGHRRGPARGGGSASDPKAPDQAHRPGWSSVRRAIAARVC